MDCVAVTGWIVVVDGVPEMQTDGIRWRFTAADGEFKGKEVPPQKFIRITQPVLPFSFRCCNGDKVVTQGHTTMTFSADRLKWW